MFVHVRTLKTSGAGNNEKERRLTDDVDIGVDGGRAVPVAGHAGVVAAPLSSEAVVHDEHRTVRDHLVVVHPHVLAGRLGAGAARDLIRHVALEDLQVPDGHLNVFRGICPRTAQ